MQQYTHVGGYAGMPHNTTLFKRLGPLLPKMSAIHLFPLLVYFLVLGQFWLFLFVTTLSRWSFMFCLRIHTAMA